MTLTPEFRDRLNELIEKRKLTDKQCLLIFDISSKALYKARTLGVYPTPRVLQRMATFFEVSTEYVLGLTDEKK